MMGRSIITSPGAELPPPGQLFTLEDPLMAALVKPGDDCQFVELRDDHPYGFIGQHISRYAHIESLDLVAGVLAIRMEGYA